MDKIKALDLEALLIGKEVGGYRIDSLVNNGKSAAVFRASAGADSAAVKIFDDELIEKYGEKTQLARIERELALVGKEHPNLVKILAGGFDPITKNHFIVMEYLSGLNLKECLIEIPVENIPSLVSQLAAAAKFLEDQGLVHRDIKPENIILLDGFKRLKLLDLGVLRPLAGSDLTDANGIQAFVGTLQYSSPKFLLRKEEDSISGWRALTFYQIGGVLHDLIMRRPLFAEYSDPYARLVNAVQQVIPEIQNSAIPYYLVELARCCLLKNWEMRVELLQWHSFDPPNKSQKSGESAKQRVANRSMLAKAQQGDAPEASTQENEFGKTALVREVRDFLGAAARTIRGAENSVLPPLRILARTPDDSGFGIQLDPAPQLGWHASLTIFVSVEILDLAAKLIAIKVCACLGKYSLGDNLGENPRIIFQGTYDAAALSTVLENCIYDLVDQVQQTQMTTGDTCWLLPSEGVG
jgi:eukaryotic-like serine/threonine-protein kinase